jgi:hypothetical protein
MVRVLGCVSQQAARGPAEQLARELLAEVQQFRSSPAVVAQLLQSFAKACQSRASLARSCAAQNMAVPQQLSDKRPMC